MRNDFLPNFLLCNTAQRFTLSAKVPLVPVQKPSVPYANFYCGTQAATLEPLITGLQEALPKLIGLLPFDGGVTGTRPFI